MTLEKLTGQLTSRSAVTERASSGAVIWHTQSFCNNRGALAHGSFMGLPGCRERGPLAPELANAAKMVADVNTGVALARQEIGSTPRICAGSDRLNQ